MSHALTVSILKDLYTNKEGNKQLLQNTITATVDFDNWHDWVEFLKNDLRYPTAQSSKFETFGWVPAGYDLTELESAYEEGATYLKHLRRGAAEHQHLSMFYMDVDNEQQDVQDDGSVKPLPKLGMMEMSNRLKELGLLHFMYTSFSSKPDHEKYRVVIPTSRAITRDDMRKLFVWFNWNIAGKQGDGAIYDAGDFVYAPPYDGRFLEDNGNANPIDVDTYIRKYFELIASADGLRAIGTVMEGKARKNYKRRALTAEEKIKFDAQRKDNTVRDGITIYDTKYFDQGYVSLFAEDVGGNSFALMQKLMGHIWRRNGGELTFGEMKHLATEILSTRPNSKMAKDNRVNDIIDFLMKTPVDKEGDKEFVSILGTVNSGLTFNYIEGECGQGKTYFMLQHVLHNPGKYLFATMKINDMEERHNEIAMLRSNGLVPANIQYEIRKLRSRDENNENAQFSVGTQSHVTRQEIDEDRANRNWLVFVTHAALMQMDWSEWKDFNLIIDEVPEVWSSWHKNLTNNTQLVTNLLKVKDKDGDCWKVVPTKRGKELVEGGKFDEVDNILRGVLETACRPNTELWSPCDSWDGMEDKPVQFISLFTPDVVKHFKSVVVMGDEFLKSTMAHMWSRKWKVEWKEFPAWKPQRKRIVDLSKRAKIHYFSANRQASIGFFTQANSRPLMEVGKWMQDQGLQNVLWSSNAKTKDMMHLHVEEDDKGNITTKWLSAKTHGMNKYQHYVTCMWLTAMKANNYEVTLMERVAGIKRQEISEWREYNALYQFVMRTNLRSYDSNQIVNVYVFDKWQAEYLAKRFNIPAEDIVHHAGVISEDKAPQRGGRPKKEGDAKSAAERMRDKRAREKEEKRSVFDIMNSTPQPLTQPASGRSTEMSAIKSLLMRNR